MTLYMEQWLRLLGGIMVLASVLLAVYHHSAWLWLTGLMGVNLVQSAFTNFRPSMLLLRSAGVKEQGTR